MEQLKHFSHEHPLILNEHHAQWHVNCCGCNKSLVIGDSVYRCSNACYDSDGTTCRPMDGYESDEGGCYDHFFLHKTCAELPQELEYPMHPDHRLSLRSRPHYKSRSCACNVCGVHGWKWFTYQCLICQFDLCLTCVLQDRSFREHEAQNHPLTLMPKEALFSCDACDTEAKDLSYFCTTCQFWIHRRCASTPTTLKCEFHKDHPLVLAYSLPEQYRRFWQGCSICKKRVHPSYWLYYCADCRFFAHIKCSTLTETEKPSLLSENENINEVDELKLKQFPMPDETSLSSLINQFVKDLSLADDSSRPADQISHWAHKDHPLVFCDELNRSNTEMKYDEMLCDGCLQPLSVDAFYGCAQCNFFLHRFCAQLPAELEHTSHPQHMLHINKVGNPLELFSCSFCKRSCNGIHFRCESCDFYIDIVCASLPRKIKHESHKHPLKQLQISTCTATEYEYPDFRFGFGCKTCCFYLSKNRAILPRTIRHRWDPHSLHLMYPPVKGHPHEFDCEMCSVDIDPNYWFYHCRDCDLSFHVRCLFCDDIYLSFHVGCLLGDSNIKFGATINVDDHQHRLTSIQNKRKWAMCSRCKGENFYVGGAAFECAPCKYLLCSDCVYEDSCV